MGAGDIIFLLIIIGMAIFITVLCITKILNIYD